MKWLNVVKLLGVQFRAVDGKKIAVAETRKTD